MGDAKPGPSVLDMNFIRPGSLELTKRDLDQEPNWADAIAKTIEVSLGLSEIPLILIVRKFIPAPNDVTSRTWIAPDGVTRVTTELSPYAIDDINMAAATIATYIRENCLCFAEVVVQAPHAIQIVYRRVAEHVAELRVAVARPEADEIDREILELMERYCPLWWGIRNMMGSAWLVGEEKLGMDPVLDEGYPLGDKISVPRQVVQTAGCLLNRATQPRQTAFLEAFRSAIAPGRSKEWYQRSFYTVFVLVFVLLHECEDISKDRERYARQNFLKEKFSLPDYVKALHQSARQLISHWLAFAENLGVDFSSKEKLEASLGFLEGPKRDVVVSSYDEIVVKNTPIRASPETWTKDLCFVSHMFQVPWAEDALYQGQ
ncbi:hypothetical protein RB601_004040 [Gaeumannomyces tritici]